MVSLKNLFSLKSVTYRIVYTVHSVYGIKILYTPSALWTKSNLKKGINRLNLNPNEGQQQQHLSLGEISRGGRLNCVKAKKR